MTSTPTHSILQVSTQAQEVADDAADKDEVFHDHLLPAAAAYPCA